MIFNDSKIGISALISALNESEPIGIPTETVYGLAAKIDDLDALKKIFLYKKRPFFDPLIVHIYNPKQLSQLSHFESHILNTLTQRFWPGPLTLVLPKLASVSDLVTSGLDSVGVRMPNHPLTLRLLETVAVPMAAPSANLFGQTSPTSAEHVESDFPQLKILDGGQCQVGIESTVLKIQPLENNRVALSILRKGVITQSDINDALKAYKGNFEWSLVLDHKHSPGHMKHHYMPRIPIVFFDRPTMVESHLPTIQNDFGKIPNQIEDVTIIKPKLPITDFHKLNFNSDPLIACRELYAQLKQASESTAQILVFEKQPNMLGEIWDAFLERMKKASSLHYNG